MHHIEHQLYGYIDQQDITATAFGRGIVTWVVIESV